MTGATILYVRSINHKTAPTAVRERAHLTEARAVELMDALSAGATGGPKDEPVCVSVIPVSTCNRTEIYLEVRLGTDPDSVLREGLQVIGADADLFFGEHAVRLDNLEAIAHLYRLASGMESLMLGEPQITAQLKDAYRLARAHHEPGPGLLRAFQGAFRAGKRVRTETRISTGAVSVAFAAVELARKFFERLNKHRAVLVGAGETGGLAARHFLQHEIGQLTVVNRSFERAEQLAATLREEQLRRLDDPDGDGDADTAADRLLRARADRIVARPWDELGAAIGGADVVLSTTGATEPVILPAMVHDAVRGRHGLPLFMLDIAVPRDVHPDVAKIGNVFVFGLEDLDEIVQGNLAARRGQIPHAERLIGEELDEFRQWLEDIDLRPTVAEFRAYLEELKDKQVGFVRKKHSDEMAAEVDKSLQQFIKKVLGRSMSTLRSTETREERQRHLETLRHLFSAEERDSD